MKNIFIIVLALIFSILLPQTTHAQYLSDKTNPIIWKSAYAEFSSSNFYIQIGDKKFYGTDKINVRSDPGLERSTLELNWPENGVNMRLYFYFEKSNDGMWNLYDLRSYNTSGSDWIYYQTKDSIGNPVSSYSGQRDYREERTFLSKNGEAKIYCKDCSITAFKNNIPPVSVYGYAIDFRIGIAQNETITISNDPMTGYGVNAVLFDQNGNVVKDQSTFTYHWKPEHPSIISLQSSSIPYPDGNCAYQILSPCPDINVQVKGLTPGVTRVLLDVIRKSDETVIASNAFYVKVIDKNQTPIPTITPVVTEKPIPTSGEVITQLQELKGEVGRLSEAVNRQQEDISFIRRIILSIQEFIQKIFGNKL